MSLLTIVLLILGLVLLVIGAETLVRGASQLAVTFGIPPLIIGLTIVAYGNSAPEMAVSVMSSYAGQADIAVGNVVGSNILNILAVTGLSATVAPNGLTVSPTLLQFDVPVMIAVAIACLPIFFTGNLIARWEGVLFAAYYAAYTLYLILASANRDGLPVYSLVMLGFALPLTAITLATVMWRAARSIRDTEPEGWTFIKSLKTQQTSYGLKTLHPQLCCPAHSAHKP
ncbi:hypothetical protein IFO70_18705 [Phormidium tenue FACHB-886]|nr:hypothetical protein [Phormidium tenue FACHB-886]